MSAEEAIQSELPRDDGKNRVILDAAATIILRNGYRRSSMDAIAREAGVAKQTLYQHFGSKEALFGSLVTERLRRIKATFQPRPGAGDDPVDVLRALGRQVLDLALSPSSLALHRVIVSEAPHFPELGRVSHDYGARAAVEALAAYFDEQKERGRLEIDDTELAAEQFLGMLLGHFQLRALLGVETRPSPERLARAVDSAVRTFLAAYGKRA